MTFFRKSSSMLVVGLSLVASALMFPTVGAKADVTIIGQETDSGGFQGWLVPIPPIYAVASDGEATFDPFGAGYDTTDGIQFDPGLHVTFISGAGWTDISGPTPAGGIRQVWVLPGDLSSIGCGVENGVSCEPVGQWLVSNSPGIFGQFGILDASGSLSDVITLSPVPGGGTLVTFASDPLGVPEPAIWAMMLLGFFSVGSMMRKNYNASALAIS